VLEKSVESEDRRTAEKAFVTAAFEFRAFESASRTNISPMFARDSGLKTRLSYEPIRSSKDVAPPAGDIKHGGPAGALSDYLLQSGFQIPCLRNAEGEHTLDD